MVLNALKNAIIIPIGEKAIGKILQFLPVIPQDVNITITIVGVI